MATLFEIQMIDLLRNDSRAKMCYGDNSKLNEIKFELI